MKKLLSLLLVSAALTAVSQPKNAPVLRPGYYVTIKGDTVHGEVQTNPDAPTDFYLKFGFKPAKGGTKVLTIDSQKAKAYGYDNYHYLLIKYEGQDIFVEKLVTGRLNFYEYRFNGKIDGKPAIESSYFIQDTRPSGDNAQYKELKKLSNTFYKKDLRPYMTDQQLLWADLDKYSFNKQKVVDAIKEFNAFYMVETP